MQLSERLLVLQTIFQLAEYPDLQEELIDEYIEGLRPLHDSYFNRLPPEILSAIFSFCVEDIEYPPDIPRQRQDLRLVCKRWEAIVNTTPSLWSVISSAHDASETDRSLQKSGSTPLSILCDFEDNDVLSFYQLVKPLRSRWLRALVYNCADAGVVDSIVRGPSRAPWLESLEIYSKRTYEIDVLQPCRLQREQFPRLHSVHLLGVPIHLDGTALSGLTALYIHEPRSPATVGQLMNILTQSPQLANLDIENMRFDCTANDSAASVKKIRMPCLTAISLSGVSKAAVSELLRAVSAPSYETAVFSWQNHGEIVPDSEPEMFDTGRIGNWLPWAAAANTLVMQITASVTGSVDFKVVGHFPDTEMKKVFGIRCLSAGDISSGFRWLTNATQDRSLDLRIVNASRELDLSNDETYALTGRATKIKLTGRSNWPGFVQLLAQKEPRAECFRFPVLRDLRIDHTLNELGDLISALRTRFAGDSGVPVPAKFDCLDVRGPGVDENARKDLQTIEGVTLAQTYANVF